MPEGETDKRKPSLYFADDVRAQMPRCGAEARAPVVVGRSARMGDCPQRDQENRRRESADSAPPCGSLKLPLGSPRWSDGSTQRPLSARSLARLSNSPVRPKVPLVG
jgi:hypothetical protein